MKTILPVLFFLFFLIVPAGVTAQENENYNLIEYEQKVRPLRVGAKLGFPNLIGGNIEYVTPFLRDKLSASIDYSRFNSDWLISEEGNQEEEFEGSETSNINFTYMEGGVNYYFFKPGRGLYGGISYGNIKVKGTLYDVSSEEDEDKVGTGNIDISHNTINIKLGAKLGGLFYFRPEVGYSFNSLPEDVSMDVVFDDGSTEKQTEEFDSQKSPQNLLFKGLIANIGFGFAF